MKKIGLIGGTGPESTLMYYKQLNARIDKLTNEKEMPEIAIESVNFRKIWSFVESGDYAKLAESFLSKIISLQQSGAEVITLTAVTMHIVFDELVRKTNIPLVSIPQAVCEKALAASYRKVLLLGTIFTMEQDFMKSPFQQAGIEVIIPQQEERLLIAKRIFTELELGIVRDSTLAEFQNIIERIKNEEGAEAVALGCTELPLLLNNDNSPLPVLDSVEIHIGKLIELAMGNDE